MLSKTFLQKLYSNLQSSVGVPPNERIAEWVNQVLSLLFPQRSLQTFHSLQHLTDHAEALELELKSILAATRACSECNNHEVARQFFEGLENLHQVLSTDVEAALEGDPASVNEFEIIRAYPGFLAVGYYRIAHSLLMLDVPLLPRILTEIAHARTGIDIHPGAKIGHHFFIDHGTGVVIGETAIIGHHVKLYQGVTLGALSVDKSLAGTKRHPTVEDHVVIYSNATILGGNTTIGANSVIGGNVWLTRSVEPFSTVYHRAEISVETQPVES